MNFVQQNDCHGFGFEFLLVIWLLLLCICPVFPPLSCLAVVPVCLYVLFPVLFWRFGFLSRLFYCLCLFSRLFGLLCPALMCFTCSLSLCQLSLVTSLPSVFSLCLSLVCCQIIVLFFCFWSVCLLVTCLVSVFLVPVIPVFTLTCFWIFHGLLFCWTPFVCI